MARQLLFLLAMLVQFFPGTEICAAKDLVQQPGAPSLGPQQEMITLSVRVVDPDGKLVAGAKVRPWALRCSQGHGAWRKERVGGHEPQPVLTDVTGISAVEYPKFTILEERVQTTQVTLSVDHREFAYVMYGDVNVPREESEPFEIRLTRGASVELQPEIDGNNASLEGIHAVWSGGRCFSKHASTVERRDSVLQLPNLPAGQRQAMLVRLKDGLATHFSEIQDFQLDEDGSVTRRVELHPAIRIEGRISDDVPRPVRNGRVKVNTLCESYDRQLASKVDWFTWAKIAEDGTFVIDSWPIGEPMQLIALCDGYLATSGLAPEEVKNPRDPEKDSFCRPQVFRASDYANPILVEMTAMVRCSVQTVTEEGEPLASVEVSSYPNVGWWNFGSQIYVTPLVRCERYLEVRDYLQSVDDVFPLPFTTITDSDGRAELFLPPGKSEDLVIQHDFHELPVDRGRRRVEIKPQADSQNSVKLVLQPKGMEYLGEWDKLAGVLFGCTGEECRRLLDDAKFRNRMTSVRKLYKDGARDPKTLKKIYSEIAAAFGELD